MIEQFDHDGSVGIALCAGLAAVAFKADRVSLHVSEARNTERVPFWQGQIQIQLVRCSTARSIDIKVYALSSLDRQPFSIRIKRTLNARADAAPASGLVSHGAAECDMVTAKTVGHRGARRGSGSGPREQRSHLSRVRRAPPRHGAMAHRMRAER